MENHCTADISFEILHHLCNTMPSCEPKEPKETFGTFWYPLMHLWYPLTPPLVTLVPRVAVWGLRTHGYLGNQTSPCVIPMRVILSKRRLPPQRKEHEGTLVPSYIERKNRVSGFSLGVRPARSAWVVRQAVRQARRTAPSSRMQGIR